MFRTSTGHCPNEALGGRVPLMDQTPQEIRIRCVGDSGTVARVRHLDGRWDFKKNEHAMRQPPPPATENPASSSGEIEVPGGLLGEYQKGGQLPGTLLFVLKQWGW